MQAFLSHLRVLRVELCSAEICQRPCTDPHSRNACGPIFKRFQQHAQRTTRYEHVPELPLCRNISDSPYRLETSQ